MRPMFLDHPGDPGVWDKPLQGMLGADPLVAPVLEPGTEAWDVYLPAGDWVDAFTGKRETGGRVIRRPTPIDELPVYVCAAAWPAMRRVFAP